MKLTISLIIPVLLLSIMLFGSGCDKDEALKPTNQCDTSNTAFNQLYDSILNYPINKNDTTMDLRIHSYTFQGISIETICKIGYQNLSPTNTQPYLIELYDSTSNTLLYSGSHIFSQTNTSYVSINPIALTVGNSYTVKRIQNMAPFADDVIGRIITNYDHHISFPLTFGNLKISSSSFSAIPDWTTNVGLPYIDLVFQ